MYSYIETFISMLYFTRCPINRWGCNFICCFCIIFLPSWNYCPICIHSPSIWVFRKSSRIISRWNWPGIIIWSICTLRVKCSVKYIICYLHCFVCRVPWLRYRVQHWFTFYCSYPLISRCNLWKTVPSILWPKRECVCSIKHRKHIWFWSIISYLSTMHPIWSHIYKI